MAGEHYTTTTNIIKITEKIRASILKTIIDTLDEKIYGALNGIEPHNYFRLADFSNKTISVGVITATAMSHTLVAESGTADDLETITVTPTGVQMIMLRAQTGHTITLKHNTGNLKFASGTDLILNDTKFLTLYRVGSTLYDNLSSVTAGGASVSSVAMSVPSIFSVAGSPITTSGTLAVTLAVQSANRLLLGPVSGVPATPTFRLMQLDDLPQIATNKLLGRYSASTGIVQALGIGTGLQFSVGGNLEVIGAGAAGGEGVGGNLVTNGGFDVWERGVSAAPDNWVLTGGSATLVQEASIIKHGEYSAKLTRVGNDCHFSQDVYAKGGKTFMRGRAYVFGAWVYATTANRARLRMNDGTTTTYSSYHTGSSTWEFLTVTATIGGSATAVNVGLQVDTANASGYIDGATMTEGSTLTYAMQPAFRFNHLPRRAIWDGRTLRQPNGTPGITTTVNASQIGNGYWTQTTAAQFDSFTIGIWLEAGSYTFSHIGVTGGAGGILTWSVDGVDQTGLTAVDWYSAGVTFNVTKTGTFVIPNDGYHVIKGRVDSKNGSASNYNWFITQCSLFPTTD